MSRQRARVGSTDNFMQFVSRFLHFVFWTKPPGNKYSGTIYKINVISFSHGFFRSPTGSKKQGGDKLISLKGK